MNIWASAYFATVAVCVIVVTLAARSTMSSNNKLLVQALAILATVVIMEYMPHIQNAT